MPYLTVSLLTPYGRQLFFQNKDSNPQNLYDAIMAKLVGTMVTINRLQTFANAIFNASIVDPPLLSKRVQN